MKLVTSTPELLDKEVIILNSDPFFNRISKDKDVFTEEEIRKEIQSGQNIGAERFLLQDGDQYVGVLEFLMNNPNDGYPWLGLLQIRKDAQGQGFGRSAMELFYGMMKERGVKTFRLGVIAENDPGHRFWKGQGMVPVKSVINQDGKEIVVYEKDVSQDFYCDEVLNGKTPVRKVMETERVLAYHHTRPSYEHHIVVIPKIHVGSLISEEESNDDGLLLELMAVVKKVAADMTLSTGAAKVITNLGAYQDSKHFHWHVVSGQRTGSK